MKIISITLLLLFALIVQCSHQITLDPSLKIDEKYDTYISSEPDNSMIKSAISSIKMINCIGHYKNYSYSDQNGFSSIDSVFEKRLAKSVSIDNRTSSGTATLVYKDNIKIAIMTCAHVVDYPETTITYFDPSGHIEDISIRQSLKIYIPDYGNDYFEILAMDSENDVVLLGKKYQNDDPITFHLLEFPPGKNKNLQWGSISYLIGYPKGKLMITRGLVSLSPKDPRGNFVMDTNFNRGFSGGLAFAFKDGINNMEWIGMSHSASADYHTFLVPEPLPLGQTLDPNQPYSGAIYAKKSASINYGITHILSSDEILRFIRLNKKTLEDQGYSSKRFFK